MWEFRGDALSASGTASVALVILLLLVVVPLPAKASSHQETAQVRLMPLKQRHSYFALVVPQTIYRVVTPRSGRITAMQVKVGTAVTQGEVLARLQGPEISGEMMNLRQAIELDRKRKSTAHDLLQMVKQKQAGQLATHEALIRARLSADKADARLAADQLRLKTLLGRLNIVAPKAGYISDLEIANGDYVTLGQPLMKVTPSHDLWLKATVYGHEGRRLKPGLNGEFQPDDRNDASAVSLQNRMASVTAPGQWRSYWVPSSGGGQWYPGEAGKLTITAAPRNLPAVPTAAMILDQGRWWVMVKQAGTFEPVAVEPVADQGGMTWLSKGVVAGQSVLVNGAYQAYHRDFSSHYANPD